MHNGRITIGFESETQAMTFATSAECKKIMAGIIADANPEIKPPWILIQSIEVLSARRLKSNLRHTATDVKVDYKVFIPESHTATSFEATSIDGNDLVAAINLKVQATGMDIRATSANNKVILVEVVGTPSGINGGVHMIGSTSFAIVVASLMLVRGSDLQY